MSTPPDQTATPTGAAMDRRIVSPRAVNRKRLRLVLIGSRGAGRRAARLAADPIERIRPTSPRPTSRPAPSPTRPSTTICPYARPSRPRSPPSSASSRAGQVDKLLVQDGTMVAAGQPLATLDNPTLKLDILTRECAIASQLGTVSGDDLALERAKLDRATQTASASYDLIKARRDLVDPPAAPRPGLRLRRRASRATARRTNISRSASPSSSRARRRRTASPPYRPRASPIHARGFRAISPRSKAASTR